MGNPNRFLISTSCKVYELYGKFYAANFVLAKRKKDKRINIDVSLRSELMKR